MMSNLRICTKDHVIVVLFFFTRTSELLVCPTEMAWLDGFVSSGFSGATGTTGGSERNHYHVDSQQGGMKIQAHANFL